MNPSTNSTKIAYDFFRRFRFTAKFSRKVESSQIPSAPTGHAFFHLNILHALLDLKIYVAPNPQISIYMHTYAQS